VGGVGIAIPGGSWRSWVSRCQGTRPEPLTSTTLVGSATRKSEACANSATPQLIKPFARGRDVERWVLALQDQWLIFTRRGCDIRRYPAIHEHLKRFKKQLIPGVPAGDFTVYVLSLLNSPLSEGYARRVFVEKQSGWYEVQSEGLETFPIPSAPMEQREWCEGLAEALIWLHRRAIGTKVSNVPVASMCAFFEQWLNGLVYELFFPDELHGRKLMLFEETARLNPPDLSTIPDPRRERL
jgi:hypothetical protein